MKVESLLRNLVKIVVDRYDGRGKVRADTESASGWPDYLDIEPEGSAVLIGIPAVVPPGSDCSQEFPDARLVSA
ncbi:MAG: hypothetical protein WCC94_11480, partial [Candidatus Bathyarchaeia archaeon]